MGGYIIAVNQTVISNSVGVISEQLPASVDSASATFSAPEFNAEISEVQPAATDAITGAFVAASGDGAITEFVPASADSIIATFSALEFFGAITELVPASVDSIIARDGEFFYQPSAARTLHIRAESRTLTVGV